MSEGRRREDKMEFPPHVLNDEEIEMYLRGDRREIDRLMLLSINRLTACLLPHTAREDARDAEQAELLRRLGGLEAMEDRARFVDALIQKQSLRNQMMEKVSQSSLTWALIAFLGFLAAATWDSIVSAIKVKLGG